MSEEIQRPQLELKWGVMWCDKHLRPLKAGWPSGAALAMLGIVNAAVEDDRFVEACERDLDRLQGEFEKRQPVCCFLAAGKAEEIIQMALDGKVYGKK